MSLVPETFKLIAVKFHADLVSPGVDQRQDCLESRTVIRQNYPSLDSVLSATEDVVVSTERFLDIFLIWTRNKIGPKTFPCGTPERTGSKTDTLPSTATAFKRVLGSRNDANQQPTL
jgi:hypothetical protein